MREERTNERTNESYASSFLPLFSCDGCIERNVASDEEGMRDWDFDFNLDEEDPMGPIISPENEGEKERGGIHPGSIGEEYCQCHRIQQIQFKVRERERERRKE